MAASLSDAQNKSAVEISRYVLKEMFNYGQTIRFERVLSRELAIKVIMIDDEISVLTDAQRQKLIALL